MHFKLIVFIFNGYALLLQLVDVSILFEIFKLLFYVLFVVFKVLLIKVV